MILDILFPRLIHLTSRQVNIKVKFERWSGLESVSFGELSDNGGCLQTAILWCWRGKSQLFASYTAEPPRRLPGVKRVHTKDSVTSSSEQAITYPDHSEPHQKLVILHINFFC